MFRDVRNGQVMLSKSFSVHPEFFRKPEPGADAPTDCTLAAGRRANGGSIAPGSEQATDLQLTKTQVSALRAEIVAAVEDRHAAAGRSVHFWLTTEIDHLVPCWLITFLAHQFFSATGTSATSRRRTGSG